MIREIQSRSILSRVRGPDPWFGLTYSMNLYRGCQHQCIYCDTRSECYRIEDFDHDVLIKVNAIDLLDRDLRQKRLIGTIGTGSMNDPYMPLEKKVGLTRRALQVIADSGFPVHTITKSDLVLRDVDLLASIQEKSYAAVSFTVTTADDLLSKVLEPGAPPSSRRFAAMKTLSQHGLLTGITLMPVLPFIEDTEENVRQIVRLAAENGAQYIIASFGMTLRDRQRSFYYEKLDRHFPGLRERYEVAFGDRYGVSAQNAKKLEQIFTRLCRENGIATSMPIHLARERSPRQRRSHNDHPQQLRLFGENPLNPED